MTRRDPMVAIYHMRDHARNTMEMAQGHTRADIDNNMVLRYALMKAVETIGGAASHLPEDFRSRYPQIPWQETRSIHNRLVHAYDRINFDRLWDIIQDDIPPLMEHLQDLIAKETSQ